MGTKILEGSLQITGDIINTKLPPAPTTDGNYTLKVSVVNGQPAYSWVLEEE